MQNCFSVSLILASFITHEQSHLLPNITCIVCVIMILHTSEHQFEAITLTQLFAWRVWTLGVVCIVNWPWTTCHKYHVVLPAGCNIFPSNYKQHNMKIWKYKCLLYIGTGRFHLCYALAAVSSLLEAIL